MALHESWESALDDSRLSAVYGDWFRKAAPWQLYCAFTFPFRVGESQADSLFDELTQRLRVHYHTNVTYIRCDEQRFSGVGRPEVPLHFHVLLAAEVAISPLFVKDTWQTLVNRNHNPVVERRDRPAWVQCYDPTKGGAYYLAKDLKNCEGAWTLGSDLDLFQTKISPSLASTSRGRRRWRRSQARQQGRLPCDVPNHESHPARTVE